MAPTEGRVERQYSSAVA